MNSTSRELYMVYSSHFFLIDIPEHVDNIVVTTAVSKSTNIAEYIVTVVWTPSTMGGSPTSYNISINGSYPVAILANGSNGSATYTYIGLQSDTVYKVSIMAFNCAGASTPAISMIRTCGFIVIEYCPSADSIIDVSNIITHTHIIMSMVGIHYAMKNGLFIFQGRLLLKIYLLLCGVRF